MATKCGGEILSCVTDATCKTALDCLQGCSFNDQVCGGVRRVVTEHPPHRPAALPHPALVPVPPTYQPHPRPHPSTPTGVLLPLHHLLRVAQARGLLPVVSTSCTGSTGSTNFGEREGGRHSLQLSFLLAPTPPHLRSTPPPPAVQHHPEAQLLRPERRDPHGARPRAPRHLAGRPPDT